MTTDPDCIFCKIVGGQIPADIVLRTDQVTAFRDINPQMPTHVLVVPNATSPTPKRSSPSTMRTVGAVVRAAQRNRPPGRPAERGYRLVFDTGTGREYHPRPPFAHARSRRRS